MQPRCHKGKLTGILFAAMLRRGYAATMLKLQNRQPTWFMPSKSYLDYFKPILQIEQFFDDGVNNIDPPKPNLFQSVPTYRVIAVIANV